MLAIAVSAYHLQAQTWPQILPPRLHQPASQFPSLLAHQLRLSLPLWVSSPLPRPHLWVSASLWPICLNLGAKRAFANVHIEQGCVIEFEVLVVDSLQASGRTLSAKIVRANFEHTDCASPYERLFTAGSGSALSGRDHKEACSPQRTFQPAQCRG